MIPEGTYQAQATGASVWQSEAGALMVSIVCNLQTDPPTTLTANQCLVQKDGTVSDITYRNLRELFEWDGIDPFWLTDEGNITGKDFEVVVVHEEYKGKVDAKIKYMNAPGRASGLRPNADRAAILNKFGSKFRAMAGPQKPVAKKIVAPPTLFTPPPPQEPDEIPGAESPTATMEEAWAACVAVNQGKQPKEVQNTWFAAIKSVAPSKSNNSDITPMEWFKVQQVFA